jgi:tetratricopeptide (TPR) repeat protein
MLAPLSAPLPAVQSPTPGLANLRAWLSAIDQHRPGSMDETLVRFAQWPAGDLEALFPDVVALLEYIKNSGKRPARRARGNFTPQELDELREMATREAQRDPNRLARRAALFHTDLARFWPGDTGTGQAGYRQPEPAIAPRRSAIVLDDGAQRGIAAGSLHWDFAREVLDMVAPDPARDAWVRRWYQATASLFAVDHLFAEADPHFRKARRLFPRDATLLAHIGCFYEALAAPRIQDAMQAATLPYGVTFDVAGERQNLRDAADAFRQALALDNRFVEARLRLARVSGLLGRNEEARRLLQQVHDESLDLRTSYYAALFAGAEEQAAGLFDDARRSYERAASLYPLAQSPHFGLSQLAWLTGDSRAALRALESTTKPAQLRSFVDDPWWEYFDGLGDGGEALFRELAAETVRGEK